MDMTQPLLLARKRMRLFSLSFILPPFFVMLMGGSLIFLAAILPLQGIGANDALLSHGNAIFLGPTHLLFPGQAIRMILPLTAKTWRSNTMVSWRETGFMFCLFLNIFLLYLLALYMLPKKIHLKYIMISVFLLGLICVFFPVVTSSDVFSYIAYSRIGVIYHHNPLTTWPASIINDQVITYIYWVNQPSAYGPVWAIITCFLQWVLGLASPAGILRMMMALRFLGLAMHLGSTLLIWSISGYLQRYSGFLSEKQRLRATLAFAWNPLLLFEAGVNAHVDATLLFFILLSIWVMARRERPSFRAYLVAGLLLALATCIKINVVLLAPALFIYLWKVRSWHFWRVLTVAVTYGATIVLLYAPFWDKGRVLAVLKFNPTTYRNINSLPEFVNRLFNALTLFNPVKLPYGAASPSENVTHTVSMVLFALVYLALCWVALRPGRVDTLPKMIGWMAVSWLLYCFIGSPWFWPWYLVTFLGLFALLESLHTETWIFGIFKLPLAVRLITFSVLTLYCFYTWGAIKTALLGFHSFEIGYVRGLWMWIVPLFFLRIPWKWVTTRWRSLRSPGGLSTH
jgi:Dolichyl-phosphate-mannose-protein mannosyltransferase